MDKTRKFAKALEAMTESKVMVGVPLKTAGRKDDPITNAEIGYIQENGSPEANIPPRPFLKPGVKNAEKQIAAIFKTGTIALLGGDITGFKGSLDAAGLTGVSAVQAKITDGPFTPLAPATLQARERRKSKGGKIKVKSVSIVPLIDTGQLRRSITYVIRET